MNKAQPNLEYIKGKYGANFAALRSKDRNGQGRDYTVRELGKLIGMSASSISLIEKEARLPTFEQTMLYKKFFGVSLDYLTGETNVGRVDLAQICEATGLSPEAVEIFSRNKEKSKLISLLITEDFDGASTFIDELEDLLFNLDLSSGQLINNKWLECHGTATFKEFERLNCLTERYRGIEWIEKLLDHFDHRKTECEQYQMYKKMSPKTGSPKLAKPLDIEVKARIDQETNEKLEQYCKEHGVTRTDAVREGIKRVIEKK